jgi:urease accessory protein
MLRQFLRLSFSVIALSLGTTIANAHTGIGSTIGFVHGFSHPFSGLDHVLAMVAIGLIAAHLGGKALWLVPLTFVSMMAVGGVLGITGINLPYVETGIAASLIVLGAAVAKQLNLPTTLAVSFAGFFAVFHGHAHGIEVPIATSGFSYALGFLFAAAILHGLGIGLGLGVGSLAHSKTQNFSRIAGGAMAVAGVGILTGYL